MAVLAKITEDPAYQCPISPDDDLDQLEISSDPEEVRDEDVVVQDQYGPAFYKRHKSVGQISEIYLETWVRDNNGTARQRGHRRSLLPPANPQIRIPLGDFLTIPPGHNGTVSFELADFRILLQDSSQQLAAFRYRQMLRMRAEQVGRDRLTQSISHRSSIYLAYPWSKQPLSGT
jgi:hypothetical protein